MLGRVCATPRDHRSQGSDSAGGFPTMAACRAGPGRSPRCSECTTGRPASLGRRPVAVRPVGSSAPPACRSAGSGNGSSRRHDHAEPCSPPGRAAASRSSASSRRAALVRGGRCRRWSGMEAREAWRERNAAALLRVPMSAVTARCGMRARCSAGNHPRAEGSVRQQASCRILLLAAAEASTYGRARLLQSKATREKARYAR